MRDKTPNFLNIAEKWFLTVDSESSSLKAISLDVIPIAAYLANWAWRSVS